MRLLVPADSVFRQAGFLANARGRLSPGIPGTVCIHAGKSSGDASAAHPPEAQRRPVSATGHRVITVPRSSRRVTSLRSSKPVMMRAVIWPFSSRSGHTLAVVRCPDRCVEIHVPVNPQRRALQEPRIFVGPFRTKSAKLEPRCTHHLVHFRRDDQAPSPARADFH